MSVDQIQHFSAIIPPNTPIATPVSVPMQLGIWAVEWIEIEIPDGPNGQVGFYLASSGQQLIPFRIGNVPNWLITNDTLRHWDMTNLPNSGDWSLVGYNLGNFPHNIQVTFGLALLVGSPAVAPGLIPNQVLSSSAA